ncbi:nitrous oxide reductase family maturation protein NosD [Chryseobacterium koreense]|uniref:Nitrous oxide reductase n=2 Tax=root TaxID=1 RepID=A0A0J7IZ47_9FLAO|nr:nitrous oxide reductase family maturation protein NosD [Chryseobacterium koreense]KMQ71076.1 nitrous oxide reductase [Chryseobacterium koreense CCUG 49689]MBB5332829.1 nitrous oxidase accessory protein [Chryseobacterium koreense]
MFRILFLLFPVIFFSKVLKVGKNETYKTIKSAVASSKSGDSILVESGVYKEGNISITKPLVLIGIGRPVLDGEFKYEILSFRSNHIILKGFKIINSGEDEVENIGAIRLYDSHFTTIENNIFENNYFGIYVQRGYRCLIQNNRITTSRAKSQEGVGDGIHAWVSQELWIKNNYISGHKDGIYLEKVVQSYIYNNDSVKNLRYGLHFMFSNDNVYVSNIFDNNNAGVAVMYSNNVGMVGNKFINNWGDGSYGLLLKDISFSKIKHNVFESNTVAIFLDGATKIDFYQNDFQNNGWGMKINANCMENRVKRNNFINNTFDVSTNGTMVMNDFKNNYWDKYEGYDLNKDGIGDIAFHPLSLYSYLVEKNPSVMLLFKTFIVDLLDKTEKVIPSLTPETFVDEQPLMKKVKI